MRPTFPTAKQVLELEKLLEHTIPENWQDQNGHVNIQHYQTLYDLSGWALFNQTYAFPTLGPPGEKP